ncbi:MAG: AI-2E family transporter [Hyphomicrobiaceae bacterium]|nr:AI-2E family transporter [Hyphomicrobiaceae bacterium]
MDTLTRAFLISGLALIALILLVNGSDVFVPLAVAMLVWFLINAIATGIKRIPLGGKLVPRPVALLLSVAAILGSGFLIVDLIIRNVSAMSARRIDFSSSLNPLVDKVAEWIGVSNSEVLNKFFDTIGIEQLLGKIVSTTASFSGQLGVVSLYVVFLLVEQQFFDVKLRALIRDDKRRELVRGILSAIAHDVQKYIWIMTVVSALTAILSYAVMQWVGLDHLAFWAFLIFILNFIPTIGSILATALPALFAVVQFQGFSEALTLFVAIGVIEMAVGWFLQPRLAGQSLNLSQFVVVLSLFVWGAIWGIVGMFLAVPLTVIVMIIFSNFKTTRPVAILLSETGNLASLDRRLKDNDR